MPKKIKISLRGIVEQIDQAEGRLTEAGSTVTSKPEKKKLAAKVKKLKKARALVKTACRTYTVIVPTA